jgi:hypothetical protein
MKQTTKAGKREEKEFCPEMTKFLDIFHRLSLIKDTRRFGDCNLSPSSGKKDTYSVGLNK